MALGGAVEVLLFILVIVIIVALILRILGR